MILKKSIIFIVALVLLVSLANAQNNSYGSHGGRIKTTGKYKIEVFGCDDHVEVYLYDMDTNAISNADIYGHVAFYFDGAETASTMLTRYGMDGFTAKIPANTFTFCQPALHIEGKYIVTEKFENECLISTRKNITSTKK